MFGSRLSIAMGVVAFALGTIWAVGSAQTATAQTTEKISKKELKRLIANAVAPEDHMRIAAYYWAEGERFKAKELALAKEFTYYAYYPRPVRSWPTLNEDRRQLAIDYSKAAKKAFELADLHEQMAGTASPIEQATQTWIRVRRRAQTAEEAKQQ